MATLLTADEVEEMRQVGVCDLSHRQLTALPPEIGQLTSLRELRLDDNQLTMLPPEIGQLTSLQRLAINHNQLTALPRRSASSPASRGCGSTIMS